MPPSDKPSLSDAMPALRGLAAIVRPDDADLDTRFHHHPPNSAEQANAHETVRLLCRTVAATFKDIAPACREQSLALTALEEAVMWATAAIARHPGHYSDDSGD